MKTKLIASLLLLAACNFRVDNNAPNARPSHVSEFPSQNVPGKKSEADSDRLPVGTSPFTGPDNAPVTVVVFSDLQCPFCEQEHQALKKISAQYGDKLRVVWKNRPLDDWKNTPVNQQMHPNAGPAAVALVAAGLQGNNLFWATEEALFANFKTYASRGAPLMQAKDFEPIVAQVKGIDIERWRQDLSRPEVDARLEEDAALAEYVEANSTPTLFINGRKIEGALPPEVLAQLIDKELNISSDLVTQGANPNAVYKTRVEKNLTTRDTRYKVDPTGPTRGPADAKVTIVAFSEFQCPACESGDRTMSDLAKRFPNDVRVIYRNFPLEFHPDAPLSAEAALAAQEQGKYIEFHEKLFASQYARDPQTGQPVINPETRRPLSGLTRPYLEQYAQELGLDMVKFKAALDERKFQERVARDQEAGSVIGVSATPTYFVNGKMLRGAPPVGAMDAFILDEIKEVDQILASGVKREELYSHLMKDAYVP